LCLITVVFSFQFSLLLFNISLARPQQHCRVVLVLIRNIGQQTMPKIWVGTYLSCAQRTDFELIL